VNRVLTDDEYAATAAVLVRLAGLEFDHSRRAALSAIVRERVVASGQPDVAAYLDLVSSPEGATERQQLLDAVTIQETHFFRNLPQIEALRRAVLPELLERARAEDRPLTVWSAGCSTGEEPYTVAMILLELMADSGGVPVRIVGTDVSAAALDVARGGVYSGRTVQLAEPESARRWFAAHPDGRAVVRPEVSSLVEFRLHNLITEAPPFGPGQVDLVVCRNVTIYFARDTTRDLVQRFHRAMGHGGYLLLGHAETLWQISDAFSLVPVGEAFVYRKDVHPVRSGGPGASPPAHLAAAVRPAGASPTRRGVRNVLRVPGRGTRTDPEPPSVRPSPEDDLVAAQRAMAEGRYQKAASLAERATAASPLLVEAYVVAGRALSNLGDDDGAIVALRKAVFLEPRAGHAHFLLATTLSRVGDPEGASLSFATAAEALPGTGAERLGELLDGRAVGDLVDLCRTLAASLRPQRGPEPAPAATGRSGR
jgi:chemotaxis protein methyltransferase CheR